MKLIFKNTDLNIELHPSNNNIGLRENDYWYLVSLCVKNDEYNYEINKEILTNNEINNTIDILEQYIDNKTNIKEIKYITNYIKFKLLGNKNLELTIIEKLSKSSKKYSIILEEKEILELLDIMKKR